MCASKQTNFSPLFLPMSRLEMDSSGIDQLDILLINGDAYIDHPAFGAALLGRYLQAHGFSVGIIAQPDWKNPESLKVMGRPRLFAAVSAGAMDSMVNHYTAAGKIRRNDAYTPGGEAGKRPNRAVVAYTAAVKSAFKKIPVVIGGIEASLRRFAHYDYWSDKVRRSVLMDSKADLLIYGMAEKPLLAVARHLQEGGNIKELTQLPGTAVIQSAPVDGAGQLPAFEVVAKDKKSYLKAFQMQQRELNPYCAKTLVQPHADRFVVVNPPAVPLNQDDMDAIYALPFTYLPHPAYTEEIPAYRQICNSITSHRGCFGGCSFCAITSHQGKHVQSRSQQSIVKEAERLAQLPDFHGTITDIGGPTANMYNLHCTSRKAKEVCRRPSCIFPDICSHLDTSDTASVQLLGKIASLDHVKHLFVSSGIRFDLLPRQKKYFDKVFREHISGRVKVAPETASDTVAKIMRKPGKDTFSAFLHFYRQQKERGGKAQQVIPYLISGHPGCTLSDMVDVALFLKENDLRVEQVQEFTPTPGTASTCMYHTGYNPDTGGELYVARSGREKRLQKALLLWHLPEQRNVIREALQKCGREDSFAALLGGRLLKSTGKSGRKKRGKERR